MIKKYYIYCFCTAPFLAALIAFSTLPMILSVLFGLITELGLISAGYYLGVRQNGKN